MFSYQKQLDIKQNFDIKFRYQRKIWSDYILIFLEYLYVKNRIINNDIIKCYTFYL